MQGGEDFIHGSYALYDAPAKKKAKNGSIAELLDEKPHHRLLVQQDPTEDSDVCLLYALLIYYLLSNIIYVT
jgi:hypothetical protein